jgi:hypothetical protein
MDQTKLMGETANDVSSDIGANEIRALNDLEMVVIAGGDGVVIWQPPAP